MPAYLEAMTLRLARGMAALPAAVRARHAAYLLAAQRDDGGFGGREGGSDLYYTSFALRGLAMLGELDGPVARRSAAFLESRLGRQESVLDIVSLVYGAALLELAAGEDVLGTGEGSSRAALAGALEQLRRPDGGYAKAPSGSASSTYHTFLVVLGLQLLERPIPDPQGIVQFLYSQRTEEGGFREIRVAKRGGTNPTTAAVSTLRILGTLDEQQCAATAGFLASMQTEEGGWRANTRIPVADLLSTFTGLLTLRDLEAWDTLDAARAQRYVESCQRPDGGFRGAAWDDGHDVEYTFYGLGSLAVLVMGNS